MLNVVRCKRGEDRRASPAVPLRAVAGGPRLAARAARALRRERPGRALATGPLPSGRPPHRGRQAVQGRVPRPAERQGRPRLPRQRPRHGRRQARHRRRGAARRGPRLAKPRPRDRPWLQRRHTARRVARQGQGLVPTAVPGSRARGVPGAGGRPAASGRRLRSLGSMAPWDGLSTGALWKNCWTWPATGGFSPGAAASRGSWTPETQTRSSTRRCSRRSDTPPTASRSAASRRSSRTRRPLRCAGSPRAPGSPPSGRCC